MLPPESLRYRHQVTREENSAGNAHCVQTLQYKRSCQIIHLHEHALNDERFDGVLSDVRPLICFDDIGMKIFITVALTSDLTIRLEIQQTNYPSELSLKKRILNHRFINPRMAAFGESMWG
jgi:hypothetical protein